MGVRRGEWSQKVSITSERTTKFCPSIVSNFIPSSEDIALRQYPLDIKTTANSLDVQFFLVSWHEEFLHFFRYVCGSRNTFLLSRLPSHNKFERK